jgi:hypothetical protein
VGTHKNTIIVNGRIIDASTGSHMGSKTAKTLDGFFHAKPTVYNHPAKKQVVVSPTKHHPKSIRKSHSAKEVHKRTDRAKTLMRSSVSKPVPLKVSALTVSVQSNTPEAIVSAPALQTQARHDRAKTVNKSHLIKRFSFGHLEPLVIKKTEKIEVRHHPKQNISNSHATAPLPTDLTQTSTQVLTSEALFTAALGRASAHEQKPVKGTRKHKKTKRLGFSVRTMNVLAVTATMIVLGGFIVYQNGPNLSMRMASAKSGIGGSIPGYKPSGFAINRNIKASPGQIVVSFNSNSDERNFNITQTASDWNSQTLVDNYVALNDPNYQTASQTNGKTIYLYGDSAATWVDGGVWYNVSGDSSLSNDQLIKLANSF